MNGNTNNNRYHIRNNVSLVPPKAEPVPPLKLTKMYISLYMYAMQYKELEAQMMYIHMQLTSVHDYHRISLLSQHS